MDIETDMVILLVSHKKEFTLLKLALIYKWQNQKLRIPIFVVYEAPNVH